MIFRVNHINDQLCIQILPINPIIPNNFHDGNNGAPDEFLEIIDSFLEIEDSGTFSESSKDKLYEQILKNSLDKLKDKTKREKLLKWCNDFDENKQGQPSNT